MTAIFMSASLPNGKVYDRSDVHQHTVRPTLVRDAVLAICRAALRSNVELVFGAHPAIAPMVLAVAREFSCGRPMVHVYQSRMFAGSYPMETLELIAGGYGTFTEVDAVLTRDGEPDREPSLSAMRERMLEHAGLVAAVLVGGMDGVLGEGAMFKRRFAQAPCFAFASAGGAARDCFEHPPRGFSADDFDGGPSARIPRELLVERVPGYTRVARRIVQEVLRHPLGVAP